jgi:hypothetical protein
MIEQPLRNFSRVAITFVILIAVCNSLIIARLPGWSLALVLTAVLTAVAASSLLEDSMTARMKIFFSLLAVSEFVKRCTFLVSGQSLWSQYMVLLAPHAYYLFFIFYPWIMSVSFPSLSGVQKLTFAYIALALLNTWISPTFSVEAKMAASLLMIMPWTMLAVAVDCRGTTLDVARTLTGWGIVSALYGFWQFCFGPTPVELNWAEAVGTLSIGASHLAGALHGPAGLLSFWRINGMQPDAITFGIFIMTAMAGCMLLRTSGIITGSVCWAVSTMLGTAILLSATRTIWIGLVAFLVFAAIASRFSIFLKARFPFFLALGMFFMVDVVGGFLYKNYFGLFATSSSPFLSRALTFGTVEARLGALDALVRILPERWFLGVGYGASSWITGKFGGALVARDFTIHNFAVELVWFVGLPGLLLFCLLLCCIFSAAQKTYYESPSSSHRTIAVICGYLLGMVLTGFGNGGVFFGYYFFFFAGVLVGSSLETEGRAEKQ